MKTNKITIPHDVGYLEFLEIIKKLFSDFVIDYHETHNDNSTNIEYDITRDVKVVNKWVSTGFMTGIDVKYQRKMAETFEFLGKILLNTELRQTLNMGTHPLINVWVYPITRKVYLNLLETGDEDKFDHFELLKVSDRVYMDNVTELELWRNGGTSHSDYEADLCNIIVSELLSEFKS